MPGSRSRCLGPSARTADDCAKPPAGRAQASASAEWRDTRRAPAGRAAPFCRLLFETRGPVARPDYLPQEPLLVPTPVTKSQPVVALKLPAVPLRMSLKALE